MVRFKKKFIFFKVSEVWFGNSFKFFDLIGLTVFLHVKKINSKIYAVKQLSYTVENRLDEPAETIFSKFSKTVKVEIRQAEKKNIYCFYQNDIKGFTYFYNDFAEKRKIDFTSEKRLNEMNNCILLSYAVYENAKVAAHCYLVDEKMGIARLMHSATKRFSESPGKQLAGKINKLLHYRDMCYFADRGFKIYDFGGFAHNTNDIGLQGINRFKLSFGGTRITCNNYSSYSYFILKKIGAIFGLIGRA